MGYATILGLDLGKFKSVCCVMDAITGGHAFQTLATTPAAIHELLTTTYATSATHATSANSGEGVLLVIETCDAAGWVYDLACAIGDGVTVTVVHTQGDERWRWRKVKRKTDRDDALKLARLARLGELPQPPVHVPSPQRRQWRRLIVHRRGVVNRRTRSRNAIRSIYCQQGLPLARGNKQWTKAGLAQLAADARPVQDCDADELWRGRLSVELTLMAAVDAQLKILDGKLDALASTEPRIALLRTVRGVGPRLAEAVVLHVGEHPRRFKSGEQLANFAGLVPKQLTSGETTRLGHISGRGPALLRSLLVESAWMVWRLNDWARHFVDKVSRGGRGRRKLAIVALARKLLILLWGMLKSNRPFRAPGATKTPPPAAPAIA
jgi:transposase